jgi:hypothetical protein
MGLDEPSLGQQTGSKHPELALRTHPYCIQLSAPDRHEKNDRAATVADRRNRLRGLSRRRSRVRVPSLPSLPLSCKSRVLLSG